VIGASGGPRIISGTSYVAMRHLWIGENIKDSIDVPRLHHQLLPMQVTAEYGVPEVNLFLNPLYFSHTLNLNF